MYKSLLVLYFLARANGGVGAVALHDAIIASGSEISLYKLRQVLKDLQSVGAVMRVKNSWHLTLLGANIHAAEVASVDGYAVAQSELDHYLPAYQKGF